MADWVVNDPTIAAEVERCFRSYDAALLGQDVTVLDRSFWPSARTVRYGLGEELYGADQIAAFRRSQGPVTRAPISRQTITTFGTDAATTSIEFVSPESVGRQTQTWLRFADGWKIVQAHVSTREHR